MIQPNTKKFKIGDKVKCIAKMIIKDHQTNKTSQSVHNIGDEVVIRAGTLSYYINNQECYEKVDNPNP